MWKHFKVLQNKRKSKNLFFLTNLIDNYSVKVSGVFLVCNGSRIICHREVHESRIQPQMRTGWKYRVQEGFWNFWRGRRGHLVLSFISFFKTSISTIFMRGSCFIPYSLPSLCASVITSHFDCLQNVLTNVIFIILLDVRPEMEGQFYFRIYFLKTFIRSRVLSRLERTNRFIKAHQF